MQVRLMRRMAFVNDANAAAFAVKYIGEQRRGLRCKVVGQAWLGLLSTFGGACVRITCRP